MGESYKAQDETDCHAYPLYPFGWTTGTAHGDILDDLEIIHGLRFRGVDLEVNYKGISFIPGRDDGCTLHTSGWCIGL